MERVLVVDDEPQIRRLVVAMLEAEGYEAHEAADSEAALMAAARTNFDLAILDVMLPGGSGIDICRMLKLDHPKSPVLILTSLNDVATHRRAIDAGADDFLTKPVHRGELLLRVRALLLVRRMERELSEQNQVLKAQRDELVKLTAQKQELMQIVVHDLKNPLAAIVSNASFLEQVTSGQHEAKDCASAISRAAGNMLRMLQNLLDVGREEEAGITPHLEQVELGNTVARTCELMAQRAAEREISLRSEVAPVGPLRADADYMRRVLENLLDNALRYTPRGGQVVVRLRPVDGDVELSVEDSGPGVPEQYLTRIFDKYAQLDRGVDRAQQRFGRGLGLTFCRLVAEAHQGRIWVENVAPRGARFCVRIPARRS